MVDLLRHRATVRQFSCSRPPPRHVPTPRTLAKLRARHVFLPYGLLDDRQSRRRGRSRCERLIPQLLELVVATGKGFDERLQLFAPMAKVVELFPKLDAVLVVHLLGLLPLPRSEPRQNGDGRVTSMPSRPGHALPL